MNSLINSNTYNYSGHSKVGAFRIVKTLSGSVGITIKKRMHEAEYSSDVYVLLKDDAVINFNNMHMNTYKDTLPHNLSQFRIYINACQTSGRITENSIIQNLHEMVNQLEHPRFVLSNWSNNLKCCDIQNTSDNSNYYNH